MTNFQNLQTCGGQISEPVLAFDKDEYSDPVDGGKVVWLGEGMGVFYSAQGDFCGHHYFGIVPVFDKGDRELEENERESLRVLKGIFDQ